MDYPEEWNDLPKKDRKKKTKELKKEKAERQATIKKTRYIVISIVVLAVVILGSRLGTKKAPEKIVFEQKVEGVSLDGKVEEFRIEGVNHISPGDTATYNTNPPTSGPHWANPADWGFNEKELPDEQLIHNLEHGGIWITFRDLDKGSLSTLKNIAKNNRNSVVITRRDKNDDLIAVVSWGRMMKLTEVDETLIQKYIDTYINQSPEKFAR